MDLPRIGPSAVLVFIQDPEKLVRQQFLRGRTKVPSHKLDQPRRYPPFFQANAMNLHTAANDNSR